MIVVNNVYRARAGDHLSMNEPHVLASISCQSGTISGAGEERGCDSIVG